MNDILYLGTRRYSSWSLRGWLAVRLAGLSVPEEVLPLGGALPGAIAAVSPSGLVPVLRHDGALIWDSLAIGEYCAERRPALWPGDRAARAHARSLSAEMHSGFRALRVAMPMNCGRTPAPLQAAPDAELQADLARMQQLWRETRDHFGEGGPFLFGAFTLADAAFAPVVSRFLSYAVPLEPVAARYRDAVRAHPLLEEWYAAAAAEPVEWLLSRYETVR
ncbi:glutathione S-transferase [Rhizosaccharibacter radicis]|uniref:Glutathione S-transferase n=1 Tax=Rhizosaccharibacter radicis TaxID=2782605 RepID=A0ABT1VW50_9PROT|nr:glutathione S-transferase [Acetobacteraceae bacterium KSS12]